MKIFAFTDLHRDLKTFEKIKNKLKNEKPDAVICAGDFTIFGSGMKSMLKHFEDLKLPLFLIPGNHETEEEVEIYTKGLKFVKNIHLKSVLFGSIMMIGCGGGGFTEEHAAFEQSEEEFAKAIKKLKVKDSPHKIVLVAHQPPYGTNTSELYGDDVGSTSIRKFIEKHKVEVCITGHLHENFYREDKIGKTKVYNPGPEGRFLEI